MESDCDADGGSSFRQIIDIITIRYSMSKECIQLLIHI